MLHAHNEILQKSEGYLSLNKEVKVLDEVVYYNKRLETYEPKDFIKSLWTQKSLILNRELYLSLFNGEDFVTAKRNQYKNFSYDRSLGEYTQKIPSIATWKRLTHRPQK